MVEEIFERIAKALSPLTQNSRQEIVSARNF